MAVGVDRGEDAPAFEDQAERFTPGGDIVAETVRLASPSVD
jgi:hypothetical protein